MATIPVGTKFLGVDPELTNLIEKKGTPVDRKTEYFSIEDIASAASYTQPYKIYRALVSQSGNDNPPTAIVLENTFGQVPTYGWDDKGRYTLTFTGNPLTNNKTIPGEGQDYLVFNRLINTDGSGNVGRGYGIKKQSTSEILIYSFDEAESRADDILNNSLIEVIVYN
jgi:hypothetical protein